MDSQVIVTPDYEHPHSHDHPTYLRHHFATVEQQRESASFGMWVFLLTEIMFFGGLFCAYLIYRNWYHAAFVVASNTLDVKLGTINTAVLICSSFTMAMGVFSAEMHRRKALVGYLLATIVLGSIFLGVKAIEYHEKYVKHHIPGANFSSDAGPVMYRSLFAVRLPAGRNPGSDGSVVVSTFFNPSASASNSGVVGL